MTAYRPSPRPTFDGPALIPYAGVTRHIWGDPEAGEVADWIYASTERVHALVFGLAPGAWFRHSPEFRTIFGADELLYVLRGTMVIANPETGEVLRVPRGGTAFFRSRHLAPRPRARERGAARARALCAAAARPAPRARMRARSRTSSRPTGATATTRLLGHLPGAEPARRTLFEPPIVWRRSLGVLEGLYASTEHLTAGVLELNPGEISAVARPRRRRGRLRARGRAARARVRRGRHQRVRAQPRRRRLHPAGRRARVPQLRLGPGASALRRRAVLPAVTLAIGIDVGGTKIAAGLVDTDDRGACEARFERVTRPRARRHRRCWPTASRMARGSQPGAGGVPDRHGRVRARRPRGPHAARRRRSTGARSTSRARSRASARPWSRATCAPPRVAEARFGGGRGVEELLYVTVGTGISCCLVLGGRAYAGARGNAICFGAPPVEEAASGLALAAAGGRERAEDVLADPALDGVVEAAAAALGSRPRLARQRARPGRGRDRRRPRAGRPLPRARRRRDAADDLRRRHARPAGRAGAARGRRRA